MWPWCGKRGHNFSVTVIFLCCCCSVCRLGKWLEIKKNILTFFRNWYSVPRSFRCYPCFHFDIPKSNQHLIRCAQIVRLRFNTVRIQSCCSHIRSDSFFLSSDSWWLWEFVWNHKLTMSQASSVSGYVL